MVDWGDTEGSLGPLSFVLPAVLDFLDHDDVRRRCALVCSSWERVARVEAPCAPKGCRGDWVTRVIEELSAESDVEAGCHVEPTAQWQSSPHVRVEKMRQCDKGVEFVVVEAVVSAEAPFFNSQPAAGLKAGDIVAIAPGDFGSPALQDAMSATATVEGVEEDGSVRLKATFTFSRWRWPGVFGLEHCKLVSPRHEAAWEETMNQPVQEGVCFADGDVPVELQQRLQAGIDALAESQPADYHPNSHDVVRDHVHPALYPFIRGTSAFEPSADLSAPPKMPAPPGGNERNPWGCYTSDTPYEKADMWGRKFEDSTHQWLPTYFDVAADSGDVTVRGDINNLRPRVAHEGLYDALANLFQRFLPEIDVAHAYANKVDFGENACDEHDGKRRDFEPMNRPHLKLPAGSRRAAAWQVITKIVDYELQPAQTHDGVWHVEGMSHEHILCTCLFVLDRGANVDGGELKFKRALTCAESSETFESFGQDVDRTTRRLLDGDDALVPLGKVSTPAGRRIVFPNSHVHRLSELKNTGTAPERRRIVAFFVVDPKARIVSTQECPDQTSTLTREEALQHRLDLMKERRLHKQDWNARSINLCEH